MLLVFSTFASEEDAARAVRALVAERLAACGTLLPGARSLYLWQGAVADEREVVVLRAVEFGSEAAHRPDRFRREHRQVGDPEISRDQCLDLGANRPTLFRVQIIQTLFTKDIQCSPPTRRPTSCLGIVASISSRVMVSGGSANSMAPVPVMSR